MKVLFFNDTRIELNPGCHATVDELSRFIRENLNNSVVDYMPLGIEYDLFSGNLYKKNKFSRFNDLFSKVLKKFKIRNPIILKHTHFDINKWENIALNNFSQVVKNKIESSDLIIINMEGTIHHNNVGGFTLLGLAYYSKIRNKKVALVNGSYQMMNNQLTLKVLRKVDFTSVREVNSYNYLRKKKLEIFLIPDFAFKADINSQLEIKVSDELQKNVEGKKCLYTVGVLGIYPNQIDYIALETIKSHIIQIKQIGYIPYYLKIEEGENVIEKELFKLGVNTISYENGITYKNIGVVLNSFELLITGRYHIGIFGLMNQIPTFFLKSNTYKIEGLLTMLGLENNMIKNNDILSVKNKINIRKQYSLPNENSYNSLRDFLNSIK
jgi:polysaccharide pyruvyl transferase WcaK-like protein